jgi:hypothetical protein
MLFDWLIKKLIAKSSEFGRFKAPHLINSSMITSLVRIIRKKGLLRVVVGGWSHMEPGSKALMVQDFLVET